MKTSVSKIGFVLSLLLFVLLFGYSDRVWSGGGEPTCPDKYALIIDPTMPTVSGALVYEKKDEYNGIVTFTGYCGTKLVYKKFCFPLFNTPFNLIKSSDLDSLPVFSDFGPLECASDCGGESMAITKVSSFRNNGVRITAWVTLKFASCQCINNDCF